MLKENEYLMKKVRELDLISRNTLKMDDIVSLDYNFIISSRNNNNNQNDSYMYAYIYRY